MKAKVLKWEDTIYCARKVKTFIEKKRGFIEKNFIPAFILIQDLYIVSKYNSEKFRLRRIRFE